MDETVKKITKRMSPKENRKRRKEECSVFLSYRKRESLWERISIWKEDIICIYPVSYTHLTLPTICSV